jgi:20S proteasome alpha/beta subunit
MIIGCDSSGSHIYLIHDPGRITCFDTLGFNAIGTGESHAVSTITSYEFTSSLNLDQTIWIAYEAKRKAEKAPGVGVSLDLCVIEKGKELCAISEDIIKKLDEKYKIKSQSDKDFLGSIQNILN